jgi:methyl-accepting chemotaxis protein
LLAHTPSTPLRSLLAFQAGTVTSSQFTWLIIFVGIAALSLLFLACVVLGAILAAAKAQQELGGEIKKFRDEASLLINKSNSLVVELTPQIRQITAKVETITAHVEHLAALVHEKADEISPTVSAANQTVLEANTTVRETIRSASATVQDANAKTRAQISRVDSIITGALNGAVRLGVAIEQGIAKPGREVAGVIAGLKASFDVFTNAAARAIHSRPAPQRSGPPAATVPVPALPAVTEELRTSKFENNP